MAVVQLESHSSVQMLPMQPEMAKAGLVQVQPIALAPQVPMQPTQVQPMAPTPQVPMQPMAAAPLVPTGQAQLPMAQAQPVGSVVSL